MLLTDNVSSDRCAIQRNHLLGFQMKEQKDIIKDIRNKLADTVYQKEEHVQEYPDVILEGSISFVRTKTNLEST